MNESFIISTRTLEKTLRDAVRAGNLDAMRTAASGIAEARSRGGASASSSFFSEGQVEGSEVLPNIDARDDLRRTALHLAAWRGDAAATDILLAAGARPDLTAQDMYTPLHFAANGGHAVVCDCLLRHSPKIIDLKIGKNHRTALHLAAARNGLSAVQVLLRHGADPAALTKSKQTAADLATDKAVIDALVSFSQRKLARAEKQQQQRKRSRPSEAGEGPSDEDAEEQLGEGKRIEDITKRITQGDTSADAVGDGSVALTAAQSGPAAGDEVLSIRPAAPKRKLQQVFAAAFAEEED